MHLTASEIGSLWRPKWFLITRMFAVLGVSLAIIVSYGIFNISTINYGALTGLAVLLFLTNVAYTLYYLSGKLTETDDTVILERRITRFTKLQINVDLVILTCMLHYSGGATNPFILYYFFHTILSSILLSRRAAFIEATVAVMLFSGMAVLEGTGVIAHYDLFCPGYYSTPFFITGMITAVSSALYIAVYMATSIMERLRSHQVQLEIALEEQRRLEEEKSRFLNVVAHDLKSPLAAIETMVTSALAVHGDSMTPEVRRIMERIPNRTRDLLRFIQDLLEFSRIQKITDTRTSFEPLDFPAVVSETIDIYTGQALERNIEMTFQSGPDIPPVMGSREHLQRMVANLVSNAIRYTPENGAVTVKVEKENGMVVFTVADTGIGIPERDLPHIFTQFYRADNAKEFTSSGTGLGMSITKAIVEQHGGSISVSSEEGKGTTFTVKLPSA